MKRTVRNVITVAGAAATFAFASMGAANADTLHVKPDNTDKQYFASLGLKLCPMQGTIADAGTPFFADLHFAQNPKCDAFAGTTNDPNGPKANG